MCKLLTFPYFPSVGKLKIIFKTISKTIFKTIFFFGIGLLFDSYSKYLSPYKNLLSVHQSQLGVS